MFPRIICLTASMMLATAAFAATGPEGDSFANATRAQLSMDFSACESAHAPAPKELNRVEVPVTRLVEELTGVWVGMRYTPEGRLDNADYLMVFNMENSEQLIYEERGDGIASNAFTPYFAEQLTAATTPITMSYLYCGGNEFGVFKDIFTKVSDNPDDAINPLRRVTGINGLRAERAAGKRYTSLSVLWETMKEERYFDNRARDNTQVNAALHTVSALPFTHTQTNLKGLRLDFVGQLRGSPNKGHTEGQPVANIEGGIFTGLATTDGAWLGTNCAGGCHSDGVGVACFCQVPPGGMLSPDFPTPFHRFTYDKVVIGPFQ